MGEAQRQIMERRSNPAKMEAYEAEVASRRRALEEDEAVWDFQTKVAEGYDPLTDWTRLREEGKITVGSEMERDKDSERLGSEGLVEVRTDTLLPYVDQVRAYVTVLPCSLLRPSLRCFSFAVLFCRGM